MNRRNAFLDFVSVREPKIIFTGHFKARQDTRNIGPTLVEECILNNGSDLVFAEESISNRGKQRFKLYYAFSKRKLLFVVVDVDDSVLSVVTSYLIDRRIQTEAVRDANKYARFASRLR